MNTAEDFKWDDEKAKSFMQFIIDKAYSHKWITSSVWYIAADYVDEFKKKVGKEEEAKKYVEALQQLIESEKQLIQRILGSVGDPIDKRFNLMDMKKCFEAARERTPGAYPPGCFGQGRSFPTFEAYLNYLKSKKQA